MESEGSDAAFYGLFHTLIQEEELTPLVDRRSEQRHAYECVQLLAPYDGENLPRQANFEKVNCFDISSAGFSFFSPQVPKTKYVVVALGEVPFLFFAAEVLHAGGFSSDGEMEYLVGCKLLHRIEQKRPAGEAD